MRGNWGFTTSGIRGLMGSAGLNRQSFMGISRALAAVLKENIENGAKGGCIAICYDSREHSAEFAMAAAQVLAAAGFEIFLSPEPMPTPYLSFAVGWLGAVAGMNITASHNPKEYNGCKIYGPGGGQVDEAFLLRLQAAMDCPVPDICLKEGDIRYLPKAIEEDYLRLIISHSGLEDYDSGCTSAVYTPLGGTGGRLMRELSVGAGLDLRFVEQEMAPDTDLAGIARPSPDERAAFRRAMALGREIGAKLLLATDPDADRCGFMLWQDTDYRLFTGNETGLILLQYIIEQADMKGQTLENRFVAQSLVSTPLTARICAEHGLELKTTPVGFRHITKLIGDAPQDFLFGFEESGGYLATASLRDKDGLSAACLLLAANAHFQRQGLDLAQALEKIYRLYGRLEDMTCAIDCTAEQGAATDMLCFQPGDGSCVYLRASGTEDKLKLYIFAENAAACQSLAQAAQQLLINRDS